MKCDVCGLKEAVIHIRQVYPSGVQEAHVCEDCARERGFARSQDDDELPELSISNLLTGLVDFKETAGADAPKEACARCGLTVHEFRKRGKLGCPECFRAFEADVRAALSQMTSRTRHVGKFPHGVGGEPRKAVDRDRLKAELRSALEGEEYEKAAVIRDRIRELGADV